MRRYLCGALVLLCLASLVSAAGLRTTFVKVTLENLRIGETYNIRELANLPMAVYNTGDEAIDLAIEVTIPIKGEFREGYEPVPDASWIIVRQDTFRQVGPGEVAMTDVLISIPDVDKHLGKRYQAMVWSHTVGEGMIACGLKSEVLFGVSTERGEPTKAVYLLPTEMHIADVKAGEIAGVSEMGSGVTLKIFNPSDEDKRIKIESIRCEDSPVRPKEGYLECPDPAFLVLSEKEFIVHKHDDKEIKVNIAFPMSQEYIGNRYAFLVQATVLSETVPRLYSEVYVSLRE